MTFDATYQGKVYAMTGGIVYSLIGGYFKGVGVDLNTPRVALTGYTATSARGSVGYQTTSGEYIILSEGWQQVGTVPIMKYSTTQAQAQVNKIIKNNRIIICNNLLCARYASKLTEEQQAEVRTLQNRLMSRNDALKDAGLTTGVQTSYPAGYAEFESYLDALMQGEPIGVATWVVVVIAATVLAATATAAYFAYKNLADESERDVKYSKDLTRTLTSKLTEEEYQQLLNETKGLLTKAKIKSLVRGSWDTIKYLLIGGACAYAAYRYIKTKQV